MYTMLDDLNLQWRIKFMCKIPDLQDSIELFLNVASSNISQSHLFMYLSTANSHLNRTCSLICTTRPPSTIRDNFFFFILLSICTQNESSKLAILTLLKPPNSPGNNLMLHVCLCFPVIKMHLHHTNKPRKQEIHLKRNAINYRVLFAAQAKSVQEKQTWKIEATL